MNILTRSSLLVLALLVAGMSLGHAPARADELPKDTNQIESLTPEQARKLATEFRGVMAELEFKDSTLTLQQCLPLNGLKSLDTETAKALAGYGKGPLLLGGLTTLDADTAKALADFKGEYLFLHGLTTLGAETAKALAEFKSRFLYLSGLTKLDADVAKALAGWKGGRLHLDGLTTLDADTAKALAGSKAWNGRLPKLTTLDAETAKALAEFKGNQLLLYGLTTLDAETAKELAEFKGQLLYLYGLTTLDADTAKALAGFEGKVVLSNEVAKAFSAKNPLTPETALFLAKVLDGDLSHATALGADTAKALAEFKGRTLRLDGLTTLDADTAKALAEAQKWNGRLPNLTTLDTPDSIAVAQALATREGPLKLSNLKKISPKTLTALIEKRDVEIPLIETLELIPEPDGSANDDFVIPEWLEEKEDKRRRQKGQR